MMSKSSSLQALRGIAVVLVVLFHMGFSIFGNGWIGVDIFFVISGFLMWNLYAEKILNNQFKEFYSKRFKRLLPALYIIIITSTVTFYLILLPNERYLFLSETFSATIGISNIYYWLEVQYFSNSQLRPLLNLWSIAVELQFYLIFPFLVIILKKSFLRILSVLSISLVVFAGLALYSFHTAFFTLPGRLWEFLLGMLVARIQPKNHLKANKFWTVSFICITLMTLSTLVGFNSENSKIVLQLFSAVFAATYIWVGFNLVSSSNLVKVLAKIGDYSYSVYLIHFPLFVFLGYSKFRGNPLRLESTLHNLVYVLILIFLSWLSKRFVEDNALLRKNYMKLLLVTILLVGIMFTFRSHIIGLGYSKQELNIAGATLDRGKFRCGLLHRFPGFNSPSRTCLLSDPESIGDKVLLVGNSHADSIKEILANSLRDKKVYLLNQNNPLNPDTYKSYIEGVNELKPETVVIHNSASSADFDSVRGFVQHLRFIGIGVVIIEPIPNPGVDVPSFIWELMARNEELEGFSVSGFNYESYRKHYAAELAFYKSLESEFGITLIPVVSSFCNPNCQIVDEETYKPFYFDSSHLTLTGAKRLANQFKTTLE
jgi:peptidoglycan/LPS O-acetylase OafA/YrhL